MCSGRWRQDRENRVCLFFIVMLLLFTVLPAFGRQQSTTGRLAPPSGSSTPQDSQSRSTGIEDHNAVLTASINGKLTVATGGGAMTLARP